MKTFTFIFTFFFFIFFYSYGFITSGSNLAAAIAMMGFAVGIFLKAKSTESFGWAIVLGIFLDSASSAPWGTYLISIILVFFLIGYFKSKIIAGMENKISFFLTFLLSFLTFGIITHSIILALGFISKTTSNKTFFLEFISLHNFILFFVSGCAYFLVTKKIEKILNLNKVEFIIDKK